MSESILRKIQKLFDLANDADDEESKAAILRARGLMVKHSISEDQIKLGGSFGDDANVIERAVMVSKMSDLIIRLCSVVSEQFKCGCCFSKRNGKTNLYIYGFERDVDIAEATFNYAFASLNYCSKRYRKKLKILNKDIKMTEANYRVKSYSLGYIDGLSYALQNQAEELISEGMELAVITPVKVKEFAEDLKSVPLKVDFQDLSARSEGYQEGKKFTENIAIE
ncbi:DUF2786 domain-containing protein [Listeria booriae]|uniref:DUF2786 domain-containing protein n=1 Tax=Listeria booriae TaxID=1552123 RepID=A0A841YPH6_9LIST|nr:DUF2786 domain-containing protein [Listeria booriae]MBC1402120.1 DUF2786 domain-containing protein [Listeria booriae]MBC1617852.1 DUF2786 domain-containing protein [Listeria booriae]